MIWDIILLMGCTIIVHEAGHIMLWEKYKIPYRYKGWLTFGNDRKKHTKIDNKILMGGVVSGLLLLLIYFLITPIPEYLAALLLIWYLFIGCRHDIKELIKNKELGF